MRDVGERRNTPRVCLSIVSFDDPSCPVISEPNKRCSVRHAREPPVEQSGRRSWYKCIPIDSTTPQRSHSSKHHPHTRSRLPIHRFRTSSIPIPIPIPIPCHPPPTPPTHPSTSTLQIQRAQPCRPDPFYNPALVGETPKTRQNSRES
jgi:hypothetical protein